MRSLKATPGGLSPLLHHLQGEVEQLTLGLLPSLDHLQDGDRTAELPPQFQHLLVRRLVVFAVLGANRRGRQTLNGVCKRAFRGGR